MNRWLPIIALVIGLSANIKADAGTAQSAIPPPTLALESAFAGAEKRTYLGGDGKSPLALYLFRPAPGEARHPVVIFFHGSGWIEGSVTQFSAFARILAAKGMLAICADYRTARSHGATPFDTVDDGRALMSWLHAHGDEWQIDVQRIAVAGASSGAHLALSTVLFAGDDDKPSAHPAALVLLSAITDTTVKGYPAGVELFGDRANALSPVDHVAFGLPPMLLLHGEEDRWVPVESVRRFVQGARDRENKVELVVFSRRGHAFFNSPDYRPGVRAGDFQLVNFLIQQFFAKLGWISAPEVIGSALTEPISP